MQCLLIFISIMDFSVTENASYGFPAYRFLQAFSNAAYRFFDEGWFNGKRQAQEASPLCAEGIVGTVAPV
jgi:hypothetical protein